MALTPRELECFAEGYADFWQRTRELLGWMQCNLINVQIPKGKPRIRLEQLVKKRERKRSEEDKEEELPDIPDLGAQNPVDALQAEKNRRRIAMERQTDAAFWESEEGRKLQEMLEGEDEVPEDITE